MIVIIDYGMGNLGSILNMLKKIGAPAAIASDIDEIRRADKLILPGVGAFDNGMRNLRDRGLLPALQERVIDGKIPILGICLGMQLMTKSSEEGTLDGLGWIDAKTIRFKFGPETKLKVPHMGWNTISPKKMSPILNGMVDESRFYFVHSYHAACKNAGDVIAVAHYGYEFTAAFQRDNIIGVQFHPEKSHKFGMKLLGNFAEL